MCDRTRDHIITTKTYLWQLMIGLETFNICQKHCELDLEYLNLTSNRSKMLKSIFIGNWDLSDPTIDIIFEFDDHDFEFTFFHVLKNINTFKNWERKLEIKIQEILDENVIGNFVFFGGHRYLV